MPKEASCDEFQRLLTGGTQLVEVLPADEYAPDHIAGAINIPLKTLTRETTARLNRTHPVIVSCRDTP